MVFGFLDGRRKRVDAAATSLYGSLVTQARHPVFYRNYHVPDTVDGRFDMIVIHAALLLRRISKAPDGPDGKPDKNSDQALTAQAVFDLMFADMDQSLREMGVGDLSVGKHVKKMMRAFYGRANDYEQGLQAGSPEALVDPLDRNLYRTVEEGIEVPEMVKVALGAYMLREAASLDALDDASLLAGSVSFAPPEAPDTGEAS